MFKYYVNCTTYVTIFNPHDNSKSSLLRIEKLRNREINELVQGHTVSDYYISQFKLFEMGSPSYQLKLTFYFS